jgi:hypothetical protein
MNQLTSLVRRYPIATAALVIAIIAGVFLLRPQRPPSARQPAPPQLAASPAPQPEPQVSPAPQAAPAPAPASPPPPPQAAGRSDPFVPLVSARAGPAPGPRPVSLPPPAPLPPPLFPSPGGPAPAPAPATPAPPPRLSAGAQLVGVLGDTGRVAILRLNGQIYIVAQGEMIQDRVRVELVDANDGLVILIEDGQRFEVRFG